MPIFPKPFRRLISCSTIVIFVILLVCMFKVMATDSLPVLGSPGALWDLLQTDNVKTVAYGAKDGSYLTMQSGQGLILAGVILVSGFGSVFVDPSVRPIVDLDLQMLI